MTYRLNRADSDFSAIGTAAYAVSVLEAIATGEQPPETPAQYAQRHLDRMLAEGYITEDKS